MKLSVTTEIARGPRSNSYNFVPVAAYARPRGAACPVRGRDVGSEGGRSLFVRLRDRMLLARTTTGDFSDAELLATKLATGQLYADVSTKLAPDDFARDLRKLEPSAECLPCPSRDGCPGCWEAAAGEPFGRDDARVGEILRGLEGRVLDVGGGEGSYLAALADRAAFIEYTCVEPDAGRVAVLATRAPWARFVVGVAEELSPGLGRFDHVLFLRSYNHLVDPRIALSRALSLLREGGSLVLVDNVAFGLVRMRPHASRAEAAPENLLEHYRNDGPDEADRVVRDAARAMQRTISLAERRDVGPHTSNQWLLRYQ